MYIYICIYVCIYIYIDIFYLITLVGLATTLDTHASNYREGEFSLTNYVLKRLGWVEMCGNSGTTQSTYACWMPSKAHQKQTKPFAIHDFETNPFNNINTNIQFPVYTCIPYLYRHVILCIRIYIYIYYDVKSHIVLKQLAQDVESLWPRPWTETSSFPWAAKSAGRKNRVPTHGDSSKWVSFLNGQGPWEGSYRFISTKPFWRVFPVKLIADRFGFTHIISRAASWQEMMNLDKPNNGLP